MQKLLTAITASTAAGSTKNSSGEMPFLAHLVELRICLVRSLLGIVAGSLLALNYSAPIFAFLLAPAQTDLTGIEMIGTGPAEAFVVKLKVAIATGIIVSLPWTFFNVWRFISPALYEKEKKMALPFVFFSTLLFLLGVSFCYFVAFPFAFDFFAGEYRSIGVSPNLRIGEYLSFCLGIMLVFGVIFEMPLLVYFLARFEILNHSMLIDSGRYAIVGIFIAAAILTPPDAVSQILLAVPLLILYGISIVVAWSANPTKKLEKQQ